MPQSYTSYEASIEKDNWRACRDAAVNDGHCPEDADECEDGELECSTCPWQKK